MIPGITKYNKIILVLFILVLAAVIIYINNHLESFRDASTSSSASANLFTDPRYEKDRTLLYGSLFLDKLDEQIKGMTDPRIQYDTKRIDIIKYADVLL
jgi:hypothetical protein